MLLRRALLCLSPLALVVLAASAGCGDDDVDTSVSPDTACTSAANAICDKLQECAPFLITVGFASRDACVDRFKINCTSGFSAPGTSATPTRLQQCSTDARGATCEDIVSRTLPESCRTVPGSLQDGNVCGNDAQCANKLCRVAKGSTCGACSSLGAAGAACESDGDCDYGLQCFDKKCLSRGRAGAACSATAPCIGTLGCVNGVCATPLAAGAACTFKVGENSCDAGKGFYCNPTTSTCTQISTAGPGGQCEFGLKGITACTSGSECKIPVGQTTGTCAAAAADGATCNDDTGPKCLAPARCAAGICTIADPSKCK